MTLALEFQGVTVRHGDVVALEQVTVSLGAGALHAIVGPNGAGKSTLIRVAAGLQPVAAGHARVMGQTPRPGLEGVVFVPQRQSVDWSFPATVLDVVLQGAMAHAPWWRWRVPGARARALASLERVGLADLAERSISALSGGQQQRVFLARALAQQGRLLLLDEPFSGVDAGSSRELFALFRSLVEEGCTLVVVHHGLHEVIQHADQVLLLQRSVIASGPPEEVIRPEVLARAWGGHWGVLHAVAGVGEG